MKSSCLYIFNLLLVVFTFFCTSFGYAQQDDGNIAQYQQRLQQSLTKADRLATLQKLVGELAAIAPTEAIEYATQALKIAQEQNNAFAQSNLYLQLGISHYYGESFTKATQYLQKIEQTRDISPALQIPAWQYLALCAWRDNDKTQANRYFDKASKEAEKISDKNLLAQNALFKAETENSAQALAYYQNALALYETVRNEIGYAKTAQAMGDFYSEQLNNPLTALYYYQKALAIGDRNAEKRILTDNLNAMAYLYQHKQNDIRMALRYYFQSFVIAQEYDFIQNGSKLSQAFKGINTCYQQLARQRRNMGEMDKAREYDKLADRYHKLWQGILQADYDVELFNSTSPESRVYTSPNTNSERSRRTVPAETLRKSLRSPMDTHSLLAESKRKADSLLIAQKNSQIDHWQEQSSRHESQLANSDEEKKQQEAELRRYKLWWFWGLLVLTAVLSGILVYVLYHLRLQKKLVQKQKSKVSEAQEKANRYVIVAREQSDIAVQKEAEFAQVLAKLDDKKMENTSFRKALQEDVLRPLKSTASTAQDKAQYALGTLLQDVLPALPALQYQPVLPIVEKAHAQVAHVLQQQHIKFESQLAPDLACLCDADFLERILVHLFYNSAKYITQGGHIHIEASQDEKYVTLIYKDNGTSVPANLHTQAFRKFPTSEARPLANGFYWAKQLMEAQKGSITLQPNAVGLTIHLKF